MNEQRRPLHARTLPAIDWQRSGKRVLLDPAADDLTGYQVYRYCSLPEALQLLGRGEWTFAHPRTWPDKYEHHLSHTLFGDAGPFAGLAAHVKCLSLEYASNALWRTYASAMGVVRIGIALQDLVAMLAAAKLPARAQIYLTRARYLDERELKREVSKLQQSTPGDTAQAMRALSLKRSGFAYENELRLCLLTATRGQPEAVRTLSGFNADKVKSVLIDPYLPTWQAEEIRRLLVERVGVAAKVGQSGFDAGVGGEGCAAG